MADRKKISDTELQAIVAAEIASASATDSSALSTDRIKAMEYYQALPFGNEIEGRSHVVSPDVSNTIEWIMPILMRMFTGGDEAVEYEPTGENDIDFAKQATVYGNYIWMRDNPGFVNLYTNFKDALLQKNGIGKVWWDDKKIPKRERYDGLSEPAYLKIANDDQVKVSEHTEREEEIELPSDDPAQPAQTQKIKVHDLVATRMHPGGRVCVEPVPPEYFLISKDAKNIREARLVGDKSRTALSQLREDGIDEEILKKIGAGPDSAGTTGEEIARDTVENNSDASDVPANNDAMQPIWKTECYIKADVDGDGVAEMRKVTVAGPGCTLISNESWDDERPYYSMTPILMPHRFWGRSVAELVMDIQLIKSTLWRQYLDNAYANNNQRLEVVESQIIDPSEVLSTRPGGVIRVKTANSVQPIVVPQIGEAMLAGLAYVDQQAENRTGISERTQGLGADPLHDTARGEAMLMTAAMGKIELIARAFAETGVKDAFKLVLGLICRYQKQPRMIQLMDKKWVPMDPRSWNADMNVSVSVGMGTGDNAQKLQNAILLGRVQAEVAQSGTLKVTSKNAMETAGIIVNAMGFKRAERFFTEPQPGEPPPPNPAMAKVEADAKLGQAKIESQAQLHQVKAAADAQAAKDKSEADTQTQMHKAEMAAQVDHFHNLMESQREQQKAQADIMLQRMEMGMKQQLEIQLAHIKGAVAIEVARIGAKADDGKAAYQKEAAGE